MLLDRFKKELSVKLLLLIVNMPLKIKNTEVLMVMNVAVRPILQNNEEAVFDFCENPEHRKQNITKKIYLRNSKLRTVDKTQALRFTKTNSINLRFLVFVSHLNIIK